MKDYNGFTGAERQRIYDFKKANGCLPNVSGACCSVCGGKGGQIMVHCEDYYDLYDGRPICVECHMLLHRRFSQPGVWIKHLVMVSQGYRPTQWKSVGAYFGSTKGFRYNPDHYADFLRIDPATLGNEWYHKLLLTKIDLAHGRKNPIDPL
jgi:hypothetical protein